MSSLTKSMGYRPNNRLCRHRHRRQECRKSPCRKCIQNRKRKFERERKYKPNCMYIHHQSHRLALKVPLPKGAFDSHEA